VYPRAASPGSNVQILGYLKGGKSEAEFRSIDVGPVRCMPRNNDDEQYDLADEERGRYYDGHNTELGVDCTLGDEAEPGWGGAGAG
jgi:hypothetical protein